MKAIPITVLILLVLALCSAAGCAATPEDRWYQQREALNTANRAYLANVPLMSDEQIVYHGQLLQAARSSLEQAKAHLPGGGPAFDTTLDIVEAILIRLAQQQATARNTPGLEETHDDPR
ncbi:MAG: hypothetical protein JJU36_11870 [Phycisphaeraceae bacterium]|nr:hypothetical protein [Phycisphaeraceae bacterium]